MNFLNLIRESLLSIIFYIWNLISSFLIKPKTILLNATEYVVQKKIGEGGFSMVYLVKKTGSYGEYFAIKSIKIQLKEQEERLLREIKFHKMVNSPMVIKLLDFQVLKDHSTGTTYEGLLLLPFYKNGTVQEMIDHIPPHDFIPLVVIVRIIQRVCLGLHAFHSLDPPMAFRDLKPANILLDDNMDAVLMDLGSVSEARVHLNSRKDAIALQELCAETVTAPYRAPELFDPPSHGIIDERSDIWALGCTAYAMAFKESPYDGTLTSIGGKIIYPKSNHPYPAKFFTFLETLLTVDMTQRPFVNQVHKWCQDFLDAHDAIEVFH